MGEWQPMETAPRDGTWVRGQRVIPIAERLMSFVDKADDGCWNWTGAIRSAKAPYGRLFIGSRSDGSRRSIGAHQLSYQTFVGPIPPGMNVCHRCDNPRCINPDHLFLGTPKDNAADRDAKGRLKYKVVRGEQSPAARFSDALIDEIRRFPGSSSEAARKFGLNDSYVRSLRRGEYREPPPPEPIHAP